MKANQTALAIFVTICVLAMPTTQSEAQDLGIEKSETKVHIGTFDSRAVAIAYYRSASFNQRIEQLQAELKQAKKDGNEGLANKLESKGPEWQELAHKQGFGTWPVNNILARINDRLPEIARQADVDVIVSKWDVAYQRHDVGFVDVTEPMVKQFDPDQATWKVIRDIRKQNPVSNEQLENHID